MKARRDVDRRIIRTRQMLSDALFALIAEHGYESITVQDIAERANIGRATFYLHYHDKEELLAESLKRLATSLIEFVQPNMQPSQTTYKALSVLFFRHLAEQRNLYTALLGAGGPPMIELRIREYIADLLRQALILPLVVQCGSSANPELLAEHAAGSLMALLIWWLHHDLSPSADEMGDLYWKLISPGIDNVLGVHAQKTDACE